MLAILQFLAIGLITSRDKAEDVVATFDRIMREKRDELLDDFIDAQKEDRTDGEGSSSKEPEDTAQPER